jgi:hypothetical protein
MEIEIAKTTFEKVRLSQTQVDSIVMKHLKIILLPGEWINDAGNLMCEGEYRHGSVSDRNLGEPTPIQHAAWNMILQTNIRDRKIREQKELETEKAKQ